MKFVKIILISIPFLLGAGCLGREASGPGSESTPPVEQYANINFSTRDFGILGEAPAPRQGAAAAFDTKTKRLYVFGGADRDGDFNDFFEMDISTGQWKKIAVRGPKPVLRSFATLTLDSNQGTLYLFGGGYGGPEVAPAPPYLRVGLLNNELWRFDLRSRLWQQIKFYQGPEARMGHGAAFDNKKSEIVLFGGLTKSGLANDLWRFNTVKRTWSRVEAGQGSAPTGRSDFGYAFDEGGLWIYGGRVSGGGGISDFWKFDFSTNQWQSIPVNVLIAADANVALAAIADRLILFGGESASAGNKFDKLWTYDIKAAKWERLENRGIPARSKLVGAADYENKKVVLFGGEAELQSDTGAYIGKLLNDAWMVGF